jgi:hypothetical protein
MKLQSLLKLIKANETLNIYDAVNNVYLHKDILKEECNSEYGAYKVVEIMTNINDSADSVLIEIEVADKDDLFIG